MRQAAKRGELARGEGEQIPAFDPHLAGRNPCPRMVEGQHRIHRQAAEAGVAEDPLHDDHAAHHVGDVESGDVEGGDQRVRQRVAKQNGALGQTVELRHADVLGVQHLDQPVPEKAHRVHRHHEADSERGQHQGARELRERGRVVDHRHRGEQGEGHHEEEQEQRAEEEVRVGQWCRRNRHKSLPEQHAALSRKLRGHYAYYGITGNSAALARSRLRAWIAAGMRESGR